MPGFRVIISKIFHQTVKTGLVTTAVLISFLFICSWPQRFLYLRQYLPQDMTMKWFISFSSLNTVTNIQLVEYYNNLAEFYIKSGKLNQAITEYNNAIEIKTASEIPYYNRGCLYFRLGDLDLAIKDLIKAVKLNSRFVPAYDNLGFIYAKQGRYNEAVSFFTKALEVDPKYAAAYYNRGMLYYHLKKFDKARGDLQKAELLGIGVSSGFIR